MTKPEALYPFKKHLIVAGVLGLLGLITAFVYMIHSTPYTMLLFLIGGAALLTLAALIYIYAMVRDIKARLESVVEKRFEPDEVIFRQGDIGDRLYLITKGEVDVIREDPEKGEIVLARLGSGEYFGEMALLNNAPRNATVRAVTDVETLTIHQADFQALYRHIPALKQSIEATMRQRQSA